jgi:DNA segregation ATPase FtsK/SpoIIIE-like protein/predicted Ser/Thr protein kinase
MLSTDSLLQGRYRVIRQLGQGGMGAVYEAKDLRLNRSVALKESFANSADTLRAFEREAKLLANLRHPALPNVSDYFTESDKTFLVMEFITGDDLSKILKRQGKPFAPSQVLHWADELLDVLIYLHEYEPPIIHRDIKPANLKLITNGKVVLLDFGLAKGLAGQLPTHTLSRSLHGYSPSYASLEQIQGEKTTRRSDLYSLAATLYHLLTNTKPPDALKRINALVNDDADPLIHIHEINPDIPSVLADVVMQGLAIKPAQRPESATELRAKLSAQSSVSSQQYLFTTFETENIPNVEEDLKPPKERGKILIPVPPNQSKPKPSGGANPSGLFNIAGRFNEWLAGRSARAAQRDTQRQVERSDHEEIAAKEKKLGGEKKTGAERVAKFMRDVNNGDHNLSLDKVVDVEDEEVAEMIASVSVVHTENADEDSVQQKEDKATRVARHVEKYAEAISGYDMPSLDFLNSPPLRHEQADEELCNFAVRIAEKFKEFNVTGKIEYICPGPVVTTYEFKPDPGVKYSRVTGLVDDLCLALKAESIRIDRVPGKAHVGIEVPNHQRDNIMLREVIESRHFKESTSKLTLALGKTIDGLNYVADLARMPNLLIAGATGTGKSVCLNSLVVSILYKARPDEVKFIMIDPKRLELGLYADIPHLATPIITDPKRAANALKWAVAQMEARYKELAKWGVRNIDGFNVEVMRRNMVEDFDDEGQPWKTLPYIVIIIDEISELIRVASEDVEATITRLTESGRSVGVHLIVTVQRPTADNVVRAVKENVPCRIAFRVTSKTDSREVLQAEGAEQLLGRGDMLFLPPGKSHLVRVHGAYLDESEIGRIVSHIKRQGEPLYDEAIIKSVEELEEESDISERDELFDQALRICVEMKRASTSVLQRRLRIGYGRAAAILDAMEREGYIGQADGARARPITGRAYETVSHWDDQLKDVY